jgi:hypothetical protein
MTRKFLLTHLLFLATAILSWGQSTGDYLPWSATRRLTAGDFAIKTGKSETSASYGQFSMSYEVNGFDFLTKNFNKKVRNTFLKTASWIDTTTDFRQALNYQQTLFDICEVYTRQFRKALKDNRKKLAKGITIAEELNYRYMAAFARRRLDYDRETASGTDRIKQEEWEIKIGAELAELAEYAYEK